ncbi:MAG: hypothetical protein OHK0022_12690 [Roseiflexaceae bacterium]
MTTPASTPTTSPSPFGPGSLLAKDASDFLLSRAELFTLQVYIDTVLQLPADETALRTLIARALSKAELDEASRKAIKLPQNTPALLATYAAAVQHCLNWKTKTFPAMVDLAGCIVEYNLKVPTYYGEIVKLVPQLRGGSSEARASLHEVINELAASAQQYADRASAVAQQIRAFHQETTADGKALAEHRDGFEQLLGEKGEQTREQRKRLDGWKKTYDEALAEYNHAVVVAATTPTYAWTAIFPPLGPIPLIIAGTIAGVYGDRAKKAKDKMDEALMQMRELGDQLDQQNQFLQAVQVTLGNLTNVQRNLEAALPVIEKIQQSWEFIRDELLGIKQLLGDDMGRALPTQLGALVNRAIGEWRDLARVANRYRVNAFIDIKPQDVVTPSA